MPLVRVRVCVREKAKLIEIYSCVACMLAHAESWSWYEDGAERGGKNTLYTVQLWKNKKNLRKMGFWLNAEEGKSKSCITNWNNRKQQCYSIIEIFYMDLIQPFYQNHINLLLVCEWEVECECGIFTLERHFDSSCKLRTSTIYAWKRQQALQSFSGKLTSFWFHSYLVEWHRMENI